MPVEHVAVAVAHVARVTSCVGSEPGVSGSVIENAAADLAGEQRIQPALLLLRRAREREDLAVARVGRLAAEHGRRVDRGPEDLVHQPELDLAEALPAELGRQVRGPQAALLDLLLQRRVDAVEVGLVRRSSIVLDRPHLLAHELAHPLELASNSGSVEKSQATCRPFDRTELG